MTSSYNSRSRSKNNYAIEFNVLKLYLKIFLLKIRIII